VTAGADPGGMDAAPVPRTPADRWLGNGFRFPLRPAPLPGRDAPGRAGIAMVGGMALVRQSIGIILDTEPGERIMEPLFGCGLRRYLMAPNTAATRTAIRNDVAEALARWEPRIRVTSVTVDPSEEPTLLYLDIAYQRLLDLRPDNLVYPFALA
jgi:uncharacterized protein